MTRFDALDGSRSGALLGRDAELGHLLAALERARAGRGALFLIGGEPGIGKSRLADEFASVARDKDAIVLWGKCWEGGGAPAYWPWIQALRGFLRDADPAEARDVLGTGAADVALMLPEIRDLIPDLPPAPPDSDSSRFQLFDSTVRLLRDMSRRRPTVVVLDDLHAADTPSILLLRFLATQLESLHIVAVGTYRDIELTPDHPLTAAMAELSREPTAKVVALQGLPEDLVGEFIELSTGQTPAERLSRELWRETNGNPLFLGEALRLLDSERRLDADAGSGALRLAVPAGVREVIRRRLAQLSPATVRILTIASAIGPEFAVEDLRRVERTAAGDLLESIGEALRAGLVIPVAVSVDRYRFFHDLVRESLYDDLLPADRADLHRQIAVSLDAADADADGSRTAEMAHHYFEAAQLGDEADRRNIARKAQSFAARAAAIAVRARAYEEASRLYRISLAALDQSDERDERLRVELLLDFGEASARGGDLEGAQQAYVQAADLARRAGDVQGFARAVLGYSGRIPWSRPGDDTRMIPLLQEALMLLGGADEELRVRLMTRLACAWRSSPDKREQSDALSREAVETARRSGDPATLGYALVGRYYAVMWPENPDERVQLAEETVAVARRSGDGELMVEGSLLLWLSRTEQGHTQAARSGLDEHSRLARELRQPAQEWLGIAPRALVALMQGDYDEAERRIDEELEVWQTLTFARDNVSAARMHRFLLSREKGVLQDVEGDTRAAVEEFPWYPLHRAALTLLLVGIGRRDEAARVFAALARDEFAALYHDNEWLLGACMAAEASVLLGDRGAAAVLYAQLTPFAGRHAIGHAEGSVGIVDRYLGLLAVALDRVDEGIAHLEQGVTLNENMGARPWAAWTRRDLALALRRRAAPGDIDKAASLEAAALETAHRLGMTVLERELAPAEADHFADEGLESVPEAALTPHVGVFRLEGDYWTIQFGDDSFRLRDAKGLRYLRRLLAQPGNELHALDLAQESSGAGAASGGGAELESDPMAGAGPRLDDDAKAAYRARVTELREELDEAQEWNDPERADRARQELEFLARELAGAVGLGGRDRSAASPAERARISVTRAIRLAMSKLAPHSAELAQHLDATIHTGTYCVYRPDPRAPIEWRH